MQKQLPFERKMNKLRRHQISRQTAETDIELDFSIDGSGETNIKTGVGFLDHMLLLMTKHGSSELKVLCNGDLEVDQHHTTEDIGIALGQAYNEALGDKAGITRYATITTPMDESLSTLSIDVSGRPCLVYHVDGLKDKVGDFDTELVEEFFQGFVNHAKVALHIQLHYGKNTHHMIESIFKGFGRTLREAAFVSGRFKGVPSTKGLL